MDILLLQNGYTALHLACMFGHTKVVKHLINNQADISATNNVSNYHWVTYFQPGILWPQAGKQPVS